MDRWQVISHRSVLEREPWLSVYEEDVVLPNGVTIQGYLRTVSREYALAFAIMPDGTVPLVSQYKHGIGRNSYDLPAGYLEHPDEDPLGAAQRELCEETGITAAEWRQLGAPIVDTNRGSARAHMFLATGASVAVKPCLDPTESVTVTFHPMDRLRTMVLDGTIDSLPSVAAIMLALANLASELP